MLHISLTRLRLRSFLTLPAFIAANNKIHAQIRAAPGFIRGAVFAEGRLAFWTRSAWESADAMKAFRDSGAHRAIMPKLMHWCDEAAVAHWQDAHIETDWEKLRERLIAEGRNSKVKHPTRAHTERIIAPLKPWGPEQKLIPSPPSGGEG
jgi:heme-degrading monooxygenase HmoA